MRNEGYLRKHKRREMGFRILPIGAHRYRTWVFPSRDLALRSSKPLGT
jgi:hypothetical protein